MDLLQNLLGGGQQRQQFEDFASRYDQGPPYDGYSGQEAFDRYQQVAPHLPPDVYNEAARDAFNRMSPQDRMQLGQHMQQQAQQRGYNDPAWTDPDDMYQDPNYLAQVTGRMHQQQPGILGQLLGGGGMQQAMGGQGSGAGDLLSNPLAKAALGGIAAMAVRRMMSGGMGGSQGSNSMGGNNPFGGIKL